jgi:hypothetical protein
MPLDLDPITKTYRAIRNALIAWPQWGTAMEPRPGAGFRPGNFPDLSESIALKGMLAPADKPMALLTEGAFTLRPFGRNSLTATIEQTFPLVYEIGTLKLLSANRIKFETMRAMLHAGESLSRTGNVTTWMLQQGSDFPFGGAGPATYNSSEWGTILQIVVQIDLPRPSLLAL